MRLYLLRHGIAEEWRPDLPDEKRRLTDEGKRKVRMIAQGLSKIGLELDLIVTSPLPRASQTAEIAAEHLRAKCREDRLLAPGFGRGELERLLNKYPEERLMIVGHEPDFSEMIAELTGASLKLSKAGVALVALNRSWRDGRLLWLFPSPVDPLLGPTCYLGSDSYARKSSFNKAFPRQPRLQSSGPTNR